MALQQCLYQCRPLVLACQRLPFGHGGAALALLEALKLRNQEFGYLLYVGVVMQQKGRARRQCCLPTING